MCFSQKLLLIDNDDFIDAKKKIKFTFNYVKGEDRSIKKISFAIYQMSKQCRYLTVIINEVIVY